MIPDIILDNSPRESVVRSVRDWIDSGRLPAGAKVPSERKLASMLNVSQRTVGYALQLLEDEGLVLRITANRRIVKKTPAPSDDFGARARVAANLIAPHMKSKEPPDALMLTTDAATVDKLNQDIGARMVTLLLDRSERRLPKEPQRICMQPTLVVHND